MKNKSKVQLIEFLKLKGNEAKRVDTQRAAITSSDKEHMEGMIQQMKQRIDAKKKKIEQVIKTFALHIDLFIIVRKTKEELWTWTQWS